MKTKQFYLFLAGIVSLTMVWSCKEEDDPYVRFNNNATIETVSADATVLNLPIESNIELGKLSVSSSAAWCDVSLTDEGNGAFRLKVVVEENKALSSREAIIIVNSADGSASASFTVTQEEAAPYIVFKDGMVTESVSWMSKTIEKLMESNYAFDQLSVTSNASWCDANLIDEGNGAFRMKVTVEENTYLPTREATIIVKSSDDMTSRLLTLTQTTSGLTAHYTFEGNNYNQAEEELTPVALGTNFVGSYNGSKAIEITNNPNSILSFPNSLVDDREMTVSFWAKDLSDGHIFHAVRQRDGQPAFALAVVNGMLKFVVTKYNIFYQYENCPSFTHNKLDGWHMITLVSDFHKTTFSTITTRLYIDGNYVDVVTEGSNIFGESEEGDQKNYRACSKFVMGGGLNGLWERQMLLPTTLTIDNLRFYKYRCLGESEVKYIYNKEKSRL